MDKKITVIGGGTGIPLILRGLKKFTENITAIVTMADDGGSSGMLRDDFNMLPPGDIRNCLVALANTEPSLEKLLQYRFKGGSLKNQNFGNILIAALYDIYNNFDNAILELSNVLKITGKVIPVTLENVHLVGEFENGDKCVGESAIPRMSSKLNTKIIKISYLPSTPKANEKAIKAVLDADIVVLGSGSLYTSIIPNIITKGMIEALKETRAQKILVMNIMTQKGETLNYGVKNHIQAFFNHGFTNIDKCIINNKKVTKEILKKYKDVENSQQIIFNDEDKEFLEKNGIEYILDDFLDESKGVIRHNSYKISKKIMELL